jgi:hypothetical protein
MPNGDKPAPGIADGAGGGGGGGSGGGAELELIGGVGAGPLEEPPSPPPQLAVSAAVTRTDA